MYHDYDLQKLVRSSGACCSGEISLDMSIKYEHILPYAFSGCEFDQDILVIPNNVKNIGQGAFSTVKGIRNIIILGSISEVRPFSFYMNSFSSLIFADPASVKSIAEFTFYGNQNLESTNIPNSVIEAAPESAFDECPHLK